MKTLTAHLGMCVAIVLTACSKQETLSANTATTTPAAAAAAPTAAPAAGPRAIAIEANDTMKFTVTKIEAKAGEDLKVTLKNAGTLPKEAMGHNWVLLKKGVDANAFSTAALQAKATDYIPASLADQVIVHTKILGPKQSDEVTFKAPTEPGDYTFICSFPAHAMAGMKGVLTVK